MSDSQRKDSDQDVWSWFLIGSVSSRSRQSRNFTKVAFPNFVTFDSTVQVLFPIPVKRGSFLQVRPLLGQISQCGSRRANSLLPNEV